ncbi:MAG: hypothetical protein LQ337_001517 [Flavoplaca oasis]|nr:MAG: hypothetical protein LQ337_001517 [Flavoplaca oasis]
MNPASDEAGTHEVKASVLAPEDQYDNPDNGSIASADSDEAPVVSAEEQFDDLDNASDAPFEPEEVEYEETIESFEDYKAKIEQLLHSIQFPDCDIEALQHGRHFSNCVYALTSRANSEDKYILRVPVDPEYREDDGVCEAILNDAAILGYLADKLPVPRVAAYSATAENALEEPYTLQTRLPGTSLNHVYEDLDTEAKCAIIDQYVELMSQVEAVTFATAGKFMASALEPVSTNKFLPLEEPEITFFNLGDEDFVVKHETEADRAGSDVKALLVSHIDGWLETERKHEEKYNEDTGRVPYYNKMKAILETMEVKPQPIVLHHWDLEARNIMVTSTPDGYKITGIIDWDDALASPRMLARRAPDWVWDLHHEDFTGYKDTDFHPNLNLSEEGLALKAHFDEKARSVLGEQYLGDAYGAGSLLRRIWYLVQELLHNVSDFELMKDLCEEWDQSLNEPELMSEELTTSEAPLSYIADPELEPDLALEDLPLSEAPLPSTAEQDLVPHTSSTVPQQAEEPDWVPFVIPESEPEQPMSLWAKITLWLRSCFDGVRARL